MVCTLPLPAEDLCRDPGWHAFEGIRGLDGPVLALHLWDPDGAGERPSVLIAAGGFTIAGTRKAGNIAAWDGSAWSPLGDGLGTTASLITSLAVDTRGHLIAAGSFQTAGGRTARSIARWTGTTWEPLGEAIAGTACAITRLAEGTVVVGGAFLGNAQRHTAHIARLADSRWQPFSGGFGGSTRTQILALLPLSDHEVIPLSFAQDGFRFRIEATEGQPYSIRHSDDLRSWHTILGPTAGPREFHDTDPARQSRRTGFYDGADP